MNRLLIVDGSNLLFQMFFGMPARIVNEQGNIDMQKLEYLQIVKMNQQNLTDINKANQPEGRELVLG